MKQRMPMARGGMAGACAAHGKSGCEMCMAEGGMVHEPLDYTEIEPGERKGMSRAGLHVREALRQRQYGDKDSMARAERAEGRAKGEHFAVMQDLLGMRGKDRSNFDEGGMVGDDMVSRIMKKRMSEGGMVANDTEPMADGEENQFDELVKDDDLEAHYPGSEEIGDATVEGEEHDLISRIMRSRGTKDRNPRPA